MEPVSENATTNPQDAFLVINSEVFPLKAELVNIGRKLDNHIVIHNPQVSRAHAQIRVIEGRFVIQDLNSTAGTYVNGQRITKSVLHSGDTISLADAHLQFVQDTIKIITKTLDRTGPLPHIKFGDPSDPQHKSATPA